MSAIARGLSLMRGRVASAAAASRVGVSRLGPRSAVQGARPSAALGGVRYLNLHEYQAKNLLDKYEVQNQNGYDAGSVEEAVTAAEKILEQNPKAELIVKAQIHAGGRGKGTFKNG